METYDIVFFAVMAAGCVSSCEVLQLLQSWRFVRLGTQRSPEFIRGNTGLSD